MGHNDCVCEINVPTKMEKLTETYRFRVSKTQLDTLDKLRDLNVDVSQFIRLAIKEKINRDYKKIKTEKKELSLVKLKELYPNIF